MRHIADIEREAAELDAQTPGAAELQRAFDAGAAATLASYAARVADHRIRVAELKRQAYEDRRADRRNRNRLLTLVVGLLASILVPLTLISLGAVGRSLAPFTIALIVVPDALVTAYALIRRY